MAKRKNKIVYVAKHGNGGNDEEGAISWALERLGCEVIKIHEREGKKALGQKADLVLFHKWDDFGTIKELKTPKVFWYFDKVRFNNREMWTKQVVPMVDLGFLTDGDYKRDIGSDKLVVLRQGIDTRYIPETIERGHSVANIAFLGSVYGPRGGFIQKLRREFGERFKVFKGVHQHDLARLCRSVDIFVAPEYPSTDHYWSNRVYLLSGMGGFLLHPRMAGLLEEYEENKELVYYDNYDHLNDLICYYLDHMAERDVLRKAAFKKTITKYSYLKRCQSLLKTIRQKNIGRSEPVKG
jgi:hypothetical protein